MKYLARIHLEDFSKKKSVNKRLFGGNAQNRTGIQGFAILCVTIPPRCPHIS